jgi:uncharacterized protein YneF (UPF0154 family)
MVNNLNMDGYDDYIESKGQYSIPEIKQGSALGFPDIILRTMKSDLDAIQKAGGNINEIYKSAVPIHIASKSKEEIKTPIFQAQTPIQKQAVAKPEPEEKKEKNNFENISPVVKIILSIIGLSIFFFIGYFILPKIFPPKVSIENKPVQTPESQTNQNNQAINSTLSQTQNKASTQTTTPTSTTQLFSSENLFKKSPDKILNFDLDLKIPNFNKYYNFLLIDEVSKATSTATSTSVFFIINLRDANNNPIFWNDFIKALGINLLDETFWNDNFESNFGIFVYKNKSGLWPGYILETKPNVLITALQIDLKKIEQNKNDLSKFFINSPDFSNAEFKNSIILNREPIRILKTQSGEQFVYGIFLNRYLILSTSLEGLNEALQKMF